MKRSVKYIEYNATDTSHNKYTYMYINIFPLSYKMHTYTHFTEKL